MRCESSYACGGSKRGRDRRPLSEALRRVRRARGRSHWGSGRGGRRRPGLVRQGATQTEIDPLGGFARAVAVAGGARNRPPAAPRAGGGGGRAGPAPGGGGGGGGARRPRRRPR